MKRTLVSIYLWVFIFFDFLSILLLVIPISIILYPFDKSQKVTNAIMLFFGGLIIKAWPGWKIKTVGNFKPATKEAKILISNHQSFLDMPLHSNLPYNFKWVSKAELFKVPVMGWFMKLTKQLSINRGKSSATDLLKQANPMLKAGVSILIYPEGTRTRNNELQSFKKGAFILAKSAGVKIQPLLLDGTFYLNEPGEWRFKDDGEIQMHMLDEIDPKDYETTDEMVKATEEIYRAKLIEIRSKSFSEAET